MVWKNKEDGTKYRKVWRNKNKEFIKKYLTEHPCVRCGYSDIRALDFDHINPASKIKSIGRLMNGTASIELLMTEIEKCQVLCANCHRIKTLENNDYKSRRGKVKE
jgi:5-methylcytosine-specific restriction endonuclease McrA